MYTVLHNLLQKVPYLGVESVCVADAQDAAYGRLQAMRRDKRARNVPFSDNRRFSAHIRDLVRDGRADEARAKCAEQVSPTWT